MSESIPPWKFAPEEVPWVRWAQGKIVELERQLATRTQFVNNENATTGGAIKVLGQNIVDLDNKVQAAFDSVTVDMSQVVTGDLDQSRVTGTWTKPVSASGDVVGSGTGSFATGLTSTGAAALDLSTIPGTRQTVWQHVASGRYGFAPSTAESKTNLSESLPFTAEDVYATIPLVYEYIGQVAIRDDPENEYYDPEYEVPTEVGLLAQHLIDNNMEIFVVFHEDGVTPKTIDYPLFGAIANLVAVRDLDARLKAAGL